jgi:hypothetical protein
MELVIFIAVAAIFAGVYWVLNKRQDVEESKTVLEFTTSRRKDAGSSC